MTGTRSIREQQERHRTSMLSRRHFSSRPKVEQKPALAASEDDLGATIPIEQYENLVNTYPSHSDLWEEPKKEEAEHLRLAPRLVIPPEQEDRPPYTLRYVVPPEDEGHANQIRRLKMLLAQGPGYQLKKIWRVYQGLRSPRPRYLPDSTIRKLFRHLSWVEMRTFQSSQRYFAFLDECIAEDVPIELAAWNTAISFAGRWVRNSGAEEVKTAVEMWMRMERAGLQADSVTFNILFDVAVKAQRFPLADTIYREMRIRKLPLNRYFRTSMIFYAGLRKDGDGVRQAFRELVNAGEIVDTAVMNCVILSLVRAGEAASAENVFAKMKELHATKFGTPAPRDWMERRSLGATLVATTDKLRMDRERHEGTFFGSKLHTDQNREQAQRLAPISPDARTYQILIRWHAFVSGDLDKIRVLIAGMRDSGFQVHGVVYSYIFRGFSYHGGHAYTAWSRESLEKLWAEFLKAVEAGKGAQEVLPAEPNPSVFAEQEHESKSDHEIDEDDFGAPEVAQHDRPPYFAPPLTIRALRAFYKCTGPKKMLQVWGDIQDRWRDMDAEQREKVQGAVAEMVDEDSLYM